MNNQFAFKGIWIPKDILEMALSGKITSTDLLLLSMINSMSKNGSCYASREYLAEKIKKSSGHVKNLIAKYRKMGLIIDVGFDGRRQKIRTYWDVKLPQQSRRHDDSRNVGITPEKTSSAPSSKRGNVDMTAHQATNKKNKKVIDFSTQSERSATSPNLSSHLIRKKARKDKKANPAWKKDFIQPQTTVLTQEDGIAISMTDNITDSHIVNWADKYGLTIEEVEQCKVDYQNWIMGSAYESRVWGKNMAIYVERFCKQKASKKKSPKAKPKDMFEEINEQYGAFPKKDE